MDANTKYEIEAYAFNVMTGHVAPGKDSPAAAGGTDYAEREQAWKRWKDTHRECIHAMITAFDYMTRE